MGSTISADMLYNSAVQCGSCHWAHDSTAAPYFLKKAADDSALCLTCHTSTP